MPRVNHLLAPPLRRFRHRQVVTREMMNALVFRVNALQREVLRLAGKRRRPKAYATTGPERH